MATLKISDLSVGDWVYHDDIVFGREIAKVHRLNKDKYGESIGITVYRSDGAFGVVGYILASLTDNNIHPIPITAEILKKNGFECIEEDVDTALYGTPSCSIFHTKGILRYRLDTPQASVACWNIHDLQHALRLAGVDKEINL